MSNTTLGELLANEFYPLSPLQKVIIRKIEEILSSKEISLDTQEPNEWHCLIPYAELSALGDDDSLIFVAKSLGLRLVFNTPSFPEYVEFNLATSNNRNKIRKLINAYNEKVFKKRQMLEATIIGWCQSVENLLRTHNYKHDKGKFNTSIYVSFEIPEEYLHSRYLYNYIEEYFSKQGIAFLGIIKKTSEWHFVIYFDD